MLRWSTRLRRAASLLLGVHLLQVILLAASAVCDPGAGAVGHEVSVAIATPMVASAGAQHIAQHIAQHGAQHRAHDAHAAEHEDDRHVPASTPHHAPTGAPCPMAMACTVTAIVAPVPTIATREVLVAMERVTERTTAPRSTRVAPEPPPPRG